MSDNTMITTAQVDNDGAGKVTFADDVIATIAALAASDVDGIAGMVGTAMSGFSEMMGRKNLTKGVKVEVNDNKVSVDAYAIVYYGNKIHEVAAAIQASVKNAVEMMTGLDVDQVNVFIEGIEMEKPKTETSENNQ